MANIFSNDVLHIVTIPQKFYLANELYVGAVMLLDTETRELILAQNSQNPDIYAELFRIGGGGVDYTWRQTGVELTAGDYTEEPFSKNYDYFITLGGYVCEPYIKEGHIDVNNVAPVITDIQLSAGLNNVALNVVNDGPNNEFLALDGSVPTNWRIEVVFSGIYVFVAGQVNWIKYKIDGKQCIMGVIIIEPR